MTIIININKRDNSKLVGFICRKCEATVYLRLCIDEELTEKYCNRCK